MRLPKIGDIWLANYPYITPGNMEKIRPVIIKGFDEEDNVIVQKLTTKFHYGSKEFTHPKMKRKTFISKEIIEIKDYNLIRYLGNLNQER